MAMKSVIIFFLSLFILSSLMIQGQSHGEECQARDNFLNTCGIKFGSSLIQVRARPYCCEQVRNIQGHCLIGLRRREQFFINAATRICNNPWIDVHPPPSSEHLPPPPPSPPPSEPPAQPPAVPSPPAPHKICQSVTQLLESCGGTEFLSPEDARTYCCFQVRKITKHCYVSILDPIERELLQVAKNICGNRHATLPPPPPTVLPPSPSPAPSLDSPSTVPSPNTPPESSPSYPFTPTPPVPSPDSPQPSPDSPNPSPNSPPLSPDVLIPVPSPDSSMPPLDAPTPVPSPSPITPTPVTSPGSLTPSPDTPTPVSSPSPITPTPVLSPDSTLPSPDAPTPSPDIPTPVSSPSPIAPSPVPSPDMPSQSPYAPTPVPSPSTITPTPSPNPPTPSPNSPPTSPDVPSPVASPSHLTRPGKCSIDTVLYDSCNPQKPSVSDVSNASEEEKEFISQNASTGFMTDTAGCCVGFGILTNDCRPTIKDLSYAKRNMYNSLEAACRVPY